MASTETRFSNNRIRLVSLVVLVLLLAGGLPYLLWTRSPQYALLRAYQAVSTHDLASFEEFVDIDGLTQDGVDDAVDVLMKPSGDAASSGREMERSLVPLLKPLLVSTLRRQLRDYISTGKVGQEFPADLAAPQAADLLHKVRQRDLRFGGLEGVTTQGPKATAGLKLLSRQAPGQVLVVRLQMNWYHHHWRVNRWDNVAEALAALRAG